MPRRGVVLAMLGAGLLSCGLINPNILDTDIRLQRQVYSQDFGKAAGTVPVVPCSPQMDICQQVTDAVQGSQARGVCDTTLNVCYAEATMTLPYTVNLSQDQAFQSGVAGRVVQFVRAVELGYSLPTNTLTFDIPEVEIFLGPQDAKNKTDPGVVRVGTIGPFKAGQTISDGAPRTLAIADGSPARTQLEQNVKNPKVPFVFLISATPRLDGGKPLPAGKLELHVFPKITVGLPR
jgi:hypothetical protein